MRSWICFVLSLPLVLAVPTAAAHADDVLGTIRIEQQDAAGAPITGGCYRAGSTEDAKDRCDGDDGTTDGLVVIDRLLPGTFNVHEYRAPAGYHSAADLTVELGADATETRVRRHEPTPRLRVVTTGSTGSCWRVRVPGDNEGFNEACDTDNDGTTTFLDVAAGDYVLEHYRAPAGLDRVDTTPFAMGEEDKTLTFMLEPAVAPSASIAPSVSGGHAVGDELTGDVGTWTGSQPIAFTDQWERCELDGTGCVSVNDFDANYTVAAGDAGKALRYRVSAANDGGRGSAASAVHAITSLAAPEFTVPPSIAGSTTLGQRLTANPGTWTNAPTFAYQWQRCAITCSDIPNATAAGYATTKADAELRIRVVVTASNAAGHATIASEQTGLIDDDPYNLERPSTSGTPQVGETMTAYPGHWVTHYGNLQFDYRWLRCGADGTGCDAVGYGDTYTIQFGDEGFSVLVEVTATDPGGLGRARSNPRAVPTMRPTNVSPPTFSGKQRLGEELDGQIGQWTSGDGSRLQFSFSWERCDADGSRCATIPGQPSNIFAADHTIVTDDVDHRLRLSVRARNASGERYAYSALTDVIALHPPINVVAPSFTGRVRLGAELTAQWGQWSYDGDGRMRVTYQWQRCETDGTQCVAIPGQPNNIFAADHTVSTDDLGHRLRVQIGVQTIDGTTYAYSPLTELVERHPPVNVVAPSFTGRVRLGLELTAQWGQWSYDGAGRMRVTYSWQRCEGDGTRCVTIPGQPNDIFAADHTVSSDDLGHRLRVQIGVQTTDGTTYAYSPLTEIVIKHPPVNTVAPSFTGTARVGQDLHGQWGQWSYDGSRMRVTYSWQRCQADGTRCVTIPGQPNDIFAADHTIKRADAGHRLRLQIGIQTPDGDVYAYAPLTDVVTA